MKRFTVISLIFTILLLLGCSTTGVKLPEKTEKNISPQGIFLKGILLSSSDVVKEAIEIGLDANRLIEGIPPIIYAVASGENIEILSLLIKAGSDVNVSNSNGTTALMLASRIASPEYIGMLLDAGADANAISKGGYTALMFAAETSKYPGAIIKLLDAGVSISPIDEDENTAFDYAIKNKSLANTKIPELLKPIVKTFEYDKDPKSIDTFKVSLKNIRWDKLGITKDLQPILNDEDFSELSSLFDLYKPGNSEGWIVIDLLITNTSERTKLVSNSMFKLMDEDFYVCKTADYADTKGDIHGDLTPGRSIRGEIAFSVNSNHGSWELIISDNSFFNDSEVIFPITYK